jgi:hypothetical protein
LTRCAPSTPVEQVAGGAKRRSRAHDGARAGNPDQVEVASTLGVTLTFRSTDGD